MIIQEFSVNGRCIYRKKPSDKHLVFVCGVIVGILATAIAVLSVVH